MIRLHKYAPYSSKRKTSVFSHQTKEPVTREQNSSCNINRTTTNHVRANSVRCEFPSRDTTELLGPITKQYIDFYTLRVAGCLRGCLARHRAPWCSHVPRTRDVPRGSAEHNSGPHTRESPANSAMNRSKIGILNVDLPFFPPFLPSFPLFPLAVPELYSSFLTGTDSSV